LENEHVEIGSLSESIYKVAKFTTNNKNKCLGSCASNILCSHAVIQKKTSSTSAIICLLCNENVINFLIRDSTYLDLEFISTIYKKNR
jgi:hypothetical protein